MRVGADLCLGPELDLCEEPALFRRHDTRTGQASTEIKGARILALFGDSITTDHISPAGSIKKDGPAGIYLIERGVHRRISIPMARAAAITK